MVKRLFSLFLAVLLICTAVLSCVAPASALDLGLDDVVSFFDWLAPTGQQAINQFLATFDEDRCPGSSVMGGRHNFVEQYTTVNGRTGLFRICEYCGQSAGAIFGPRYDDYVTELPVSGIGSDGSLIWYPTVSDCYVNNSSSTLSVSCIGSYYLSFDSPSYLSPNGLAYSIVDSRSVSVIGTVLSPYVGTLSDFHLYGTSFIAPISGTYYLLDTFLGSYSGSAGSASFYYRSGPSYTAFAGASFRPNINNIVSSRPVFGSISACLYLPVFKVVPSVDLSSDQWNFYVPNSRTGVITGGLGIIGDNGSITQINNNYVFNETNNTYYNPTNNTYNTVNQWYYDYTTRTYTLTLDTGETITLTYGDDNITINQGDTITNVYYIIDGTGGGGENPGPGTDPDPGPSDDPGLEDGESVTWLQKIYNKLCEILAAITGLNFSPSVDVDVDVTIPGDSEEEKQENWFAEFASKFSFISVLHDIYKQLIADVTSDAQSAAAVSAGTVSIDALTSGHAAPLDGAGGVGSYTAPELSVALGSSDKYGVDWAGVKAVDLSWYAPYKETVDSIVSGILWLSYIFMLIKRAPGIIRGAEMITEDGIKIDNYRWYNGL